MSAVTDALEPVKLPTDRQPTIRIIPMPADTNANGTIFGGWVMAQVDLAGSVPASERAMGRVVTVAVNSFLFKEPASTRKLLRPGAHQSRLRLKCMRSAIVLARKS
jgi:acyl-CoA thioesterase YciA